MKTLPVLSHTTSKLSYARLKNAHLPTYAEQSGLTP